jgi:hypothetical protein
MDFGAGLSESEAGGASNWKTPPTFGRRSQLLRAASVT